MVKEFIRTPSHSCQTPDPVPENPPSPFHSTEAVAKKNGTGRRHSQVEQTQSTDWEVGLKSKNYHGNRTGKVDPDKRLLERVASELYHCQENLLGLAQNLSPPSTEREEEEGEDEVIRPLLPCLKAAVENGTGRREMSNGCPEVEVHPSSAPSPTGPLRSQDSYRDLLTILESSPDKDDSLSPTSPPQFRPKLDTIAVHSEACLNRPRGPGFHTIQRHTRNPLLSRDATFNDFSRKTESYGYEGPPSPQTKERFVPPRAGEGEGGRGRRASRVDVKKFTRKTAIRRQRRKVGGSTSELPPETSYSFHVSLSLSPPPPLSLSSLPLPSLFPLSPSPLSFSLSLSCTMWTCVAVIKFRATTCWHGIHDY